MREQAVASRKLLDSSSDTAAVVQVQMTGANENATAQIAQELGNVVANNALQVYLDSPRSFAFEA